MRAPAPVVPSTLALCAGCGVGDTWRLDPAPAPLRRRWRWHWRCRCRCRCRCRSRSRSLLGGVILLAALGVGAEGCAEAEPLTLLTYNVKGLDWTNTSNPGYPLAARTADLVTTIQSQAPDLVAIQEGWRRSAGGSLEQELATACGLPHHVAVTTTRGWLPYVQQNVILSRHPLDSSETLDLGPDPSSYESRKLQVVKVQTPGGALCVGNLHLFTDRTLQRPALEQAAVFLSRRCEGLPTALAGDFNFEPAQDPAGPYAYLASRTALRDPVVTLGQDPRDARYHSSPAAGPRKRIDYIFLGGGAAPLDYRVVDAPIPNKTYPDHLPVQARLLLEQP